MVHKTYGMRHTNSRLSDREEEIGRLVVDAAYAVHIRLGPGLLERVYEVCFCHELKKRTLEAQRQVKVPIIYDNIEFEEAFRLDVLVEELVVVELKAVETMNPLFRAQLTTQLKLTNRRLGFLINFNVEKIKDGITRVVA